MMLRALSLGLGLMSSVAAQAECRQALALGLDVSGSVDAREYRLQTDGLAAALLAPDVQAAFLVLPELPVRLMIYEWSGLYDQRIVQDWITIDSAERLQDVATRLTRTRKSGGDDPTTAISAAVLFGVEALATQRDCARKTLDISGDGPANIGRHPGELRTDELHQSVINALVIGPNSRSNTGKNLRNVLSLEAYYRAHVIHGTGAFAELAQTHADFAAAMRRKLVRELRLPSLSRLDRHP